MFKLWLPTTSGGALAGNDQQLPKQPPGNLQRYRCAACTLNAVTKLNHTSIHTQQVCCCLRDTISVDARCKLHGDSSLCSCVITRLVSSTTHQPPDVHSCSARRAEYYNIPSNDPNSPAAQPAQLAHNKHCRTVLVRHTEVDSTAQHTSVHVPPHRVTPHSTGCSSFSSALLTLNDSSCCHASY
jgi:hypothetical protein